MRKRCDMTGTALAILFDLGVLAYLAWLTRDLVLQYRTWQWTETKCSITRIDHGVSSQGDHVVQPRYTYGFAGKRYTGHELHRGERRSFHLESRAKEYGQELKDTVTKAWVNPAAPEEAVLFQGIPSGDMLRWIGTASLCLVVTLAIVLRG